MAAEGPAAAASVHELETLRESERQLELKLAQQRRREGELILRLAIRERELREARDSLRRAAAKPEHKQLESLMLDPAVNLEVLKLREQVCTPPAASPATIARLLGSCAAVIAVS